MRGPWGGVKWGQMGPKVVFLKIGGNNEKNEKDPNCLFEMSRTIFYQTHPVKKKRKNAMG